jgi:glutaredoxin-like protein NrdH
VAEEAKERTGVRVAPIMVIGMQCFYGTFSSQREKLDLLALPQEA